MAQCKALANKPDSWSLIPGTHVKAEERPDSTGCLLTHTHAHLRTSTHTHTTITVILKENIER